MITIKQIENWFGSNATKEDYLSILEMIINSRYKPETFKPDVEQYEEE